MNNQSLSELSPEQKRALITQLLQQKANSPSSVPLSWGQQGIWLLEQLIPNTSIHNIPIAYHIKGALNTNVLEKSIHKIVEHHDILRSRFSVVEGQPIAIIQPTLNFQISIIELQNLSQREKDQETQKILIQEAQNPFDMQSNQLWRIKLLQLSSEDYALFFTVHHIIFDGWSFNIFFKELEQYYQSFITNNLPKLNPSSLQYNQFFHWQKDKLQGEILEKLTNYWQEQLKDFSTNLELSKDFKKDNLNISKYNRQTIELESGLVEQLKQFSHQANVTVFMTLLAVFYTLLQFYSKQNDLVICSPISGRHRSQAKGVIGYVNNLLPLRINSSDKATFEDLLSQIHQITLDAYEHQDLPFPMIREIPNLKRAKLTQIVFSLTDEWPPKIQLPDLEIKPLEMADGIANFVVLRSVRPNISLSIENKDETIKAVLESNQELLSLSMMTNILGDFQTLLKDLIAHPTQPINSLLSFLKTQSPRIIFQENQPQINRQKIKNRDYNDVEIKILKVWQKVLEIQDIEINDDFFQLGGNSITAARLFTKIEEELGQKLPLVALLQASTIEKQAMMLQQKKYYALWDSLVPIQTQGNKPPLFCCPGVYGNVLYFRGLSQYLGDNQPVYGLQSKGLDGQQQPFETIKEMATEQIKDIQKIQPHGPYFLCGHSFGGKLAFEIAQQLYSQGEEVAFLGLFDEEAIPLDWYNRTIGQLMILSDKKIESSFLYIWKKLKNKFNNKVIKKNDRSIQNYHQKVSANKPLFSPQVHKANEQAYHNYKCKPYPGCVTLFRTVRLSKLFDHSVSLGQWDKFALGGVNTEDIQGDHFNLLDEPYVQVLAQKLKKCLENIV